MAKPALSPDGKRREICRLVVNCTLLAGRSGEGLHSFPPKIRLATKRRQLVSWFFSVVVVVVVVAVVVIIVIIETESEKKKEVTAWSVAWTRKEMQAIKRK